MQLHLNHDSDSAELEIKSDSVSFFKMDNLSVNGSSVDIASNKIDINSSINNDNTDDNSGKAVLLNTCNESAIKVELAEVQNDVCKSLLNDICSKVEELEYDCNLENSQNLKYDSDIKQENCSDSETSLSELKNGSKNNVCVDNCISNGKVSDSSEVTSYNLDIVKKEPEENPTEEISEPVIERPLEKNRTFDEIAKSNDPVVKTEPIPSEETNPAPSIKTEPVEISENLVESSSIDKDPNSSETHLNDKTASIKLADDEDDCFISDVVKNEYPEISLDSKNNTSKNSSSDEIIHDKEECNAVSHSRLIHQNDAMVVVANTNTNLLPNDLDDNDVLSINSDNDSLKKTISNKDILNNLSNNIDVDKDGEISLFIKNKLGDEIQNTKTQKCEEKINNQSLIIDTLDLLLSDDECDINKPSDELDKFQGMKKNENLKESDMIFSKSDNVNSKSLLKRSDTDCKNVHEEQKGNSKISCEMETENISSPRNEINESESKDTTGENLTNILKKYLVNKTTKKEVIFPTNFMAKFKNSFGKMSREDLEELCLVKIVEAIAKRSNLAEADARLRAQSKSIDVLRKTLSSVTKQNRDLELVMKNLLNEHKKRKNEVIEPVKIARSVGFQVGPSSFKIKGNKSQTSTSLPTQTSSAQQVKNPTKLIIANPNPAVNSGHSTKPIEPLKKLTNNNKTFQSQFVSTVASDMKTIVSVVPTSPTTARPVNIKPKLPEKRSADQSIDLTDDEPPTKQIHLGNRIKTPITIPRFTNGISADGNNRVQIQNPNSIPVKLYSPLQSNNQVISPLSQFRTLNTDTSGVTKLSIPIRPSNAPVTNATFPEHPAPLPNAITGFKWKPPQPTLRISRVKNGIVVSWDVENNANNRYYTVASYQIYAYQETSALPHTDLWKKIGDVKALPLPMACTLTQFMSGYRYYFAVRGVDVKQRFGVFSAPASILLTDDNRE